MNYENSNIRIRQNKRGFAVEIKKPRWTLFGIRWSWIPYLSTAGMPEELWYYKTKEMAISETIRHINTDIFNNSL